MRSRQKQHLKIKQKTKLSKQLIKAYGMPQPKKKKFKKHLGSTSNNNNNPYYEVKQFETIEGRNSPTKTMKKKLSKDQIMLSSGVEEFDEQYEMYNKLVVENNNLYKTAMKLPKKVRKMLKASAPDYFKTSP